MGLSKEILRPETRMTFPPVSPSSSEIKVNILPTKEAGAEARIRELSQMLSAEGKDEKEVDEQPQEKALRKDGFEPFVNPKPQENELFINSYNGNFATKMELNRKGIERVLKIAHLEGQVFLTSLSPSRQRSIEANPDGSVSAKQSLFFGEKTEEDGKDNPLSKVVAVPQGWKIEINDTKITEDLNEKGLIGEKQQKTFIKQFNQLLNKSLFECIRKEKMTSIKDESFGTKVLLSVLNPGIFFPIALAPRLFQFDLPDITLIMFPYFTINACSNLSGLPLWKKRQIDTLWEYFMPQIEIDKVVRAQIFLGLKGRTLVREAKSENK